jgi:hypothetical protein
MSDGGRGRALLEVQVLKSSQKWSVQGSAVRSIVWLDLFGKSDIMQVLLYGNRLLSNLLAVAVIEALREKCRR